MLHNQEGSPLTKWKAVCYNYKSVEIFESADIQLRNLDESNASTIPILHDECANFYEFCMIFPSLKGVITESGKVMVQSLFALGFELKFYRGINESEVVVLLRVPMSVARDYAEESEMDVLLDEYIAERMLQHGDAGNKISPVVIEHRAEITPFRPCQFIYAPYHSQLEHLYQVKRKEDGSPMHPFKELLKLKICAMLLQSRLPDGSGGLHIRQAISENKLLACFPLHNPANVQALNVLWDKYPYDPLPLDEIKEYFGEKVGLYFAFADHLTEALVYPALVGIPLQFYVFMADSLSGTRK